MDTLRKSLKILSLAFILFTFLPAYSQKELWGYKTNNPGAMIKAPLEGSNHDPDILHTFDPTGIEGTSPKDRIFQASNGKLYGIAISAGGQDIPNGVLFEYDPAIDQYRVLNNSIIDSNGGNLFGLIEPIPGWLYGTTNGGRSVFKYNIETEEASIVATIPLFLYNNNNYYPRFNGELMMASDGNLYGVTDMAPSVQNVPYPGGIYRLNLATGQLTKLYVMGINGSDVIYPMYGTKLVEGAPGKLYGTSYGGSHIGPQGVAPIGSGTLFEYTIATSTMTKKYDFDYNTIGCNPTQIIKSGNKLYGALAGISNSQAYPNANGLLYEYDLSSEALTILYVFASNGEQIKTPQGFLLKASDGNFYGGYVSGIYRYDPVASTVIKHTNGSSAYELQSPIEVCRKPAYHFFETSSFVVCEGAPFSFDIQNTNAATYVWRKGSTILPSQITGVLNFDSVTVANTGIYTCTMTNECGTTVTMPLQLTVEVCMGIDEVNALKGIRLYPNPANNILNLSLPDNPEFEIQKVFIINILGQTVYSAAYSEISIDISAFGTGLYQIILSTDKGNWNGKFIKE